MKYAVAEYHQKVFSHLPFKKNSKKKVLDVGCGEGLDARILQQKGYTVYGTDVFAHTNIKNVLGKQFMIGSIYKIPFKSNYFDYVYLHNVLHHIDEKNQDFKKHIAGIKELKRVCKRNGKIVILEANRYNPLFYPHMVLLKKHQHFTQKHFQKVCLAASKNVEFAYFEAHVYPDKFKKFFYIYEVAMEKIPFLRPFLAYNVAIFINK